MHTTDARNHWLDTYSLDHNHKVNLAVYFADFNVFITWLKHSPCVAQFL